MGRRDALKCAQRDLMTAAERDRQSALSQGARDRFAKLRLGGLERIVSATDVARVREAWLVQHWQVRKSRAYRSRSACRADAAAIAPHALVTWKADQHGAAVDIGIEGPHDLVPAPRVPGFLNVLSSAPRRAEVIVADIPFSWI